MIKRLTLLLLSCLLCCASFASCADSEDAISSAYKGPEPSVEPKASPSPTPEPRTEVGIPEELKFCDEPLYYGMTIEEIREIFGQEEKMYELDFYEDRKLIGKHAYYVYDNIQCQGSPIGLEFRLFNYEGLVCQKSYGLDSIVIKWLDLPNREEKVSFMEEKLKPVIENLYGAPDYEGTKPIRMCWYYQLGEKAHDGIDMMVLADGPQIEFEYSLVDIWGGVGLRDEAAMYKESGKQGLTLENLNRLKEGMSYEQAEMLLGTCTEEVDRYTAGGATYVTSAWEDDLGAYLKITFCDGGIYSIYSSGIR